MQNTNILIVAEEFERFKHNRDAAYVRYNALERAGMHRRLTPAEREELDRLEVITDLYDHVWFGLLGQQ